MSSKGLTTVQKSAIIYISKVRGGVSCKIKKVIADALVRRGYAYRVRVPLVDKEGLALTEAGKWYAKTGEQIA